MWTLSYGNITRIDMMRGFDKKRRNAFRVVFDDGRRGWFKVKATTSR